MGRFPPQADSAAAGTLLSHGYRCIDGVLGNGQDNPVYVCKSFVDAALSLVYVLLPHAVYPASGGVCRPVTGQAGELLSAEMDNASLHTHRRIIPDGVDE